MMNTKQNERIISNLGFLISKIGNCSFKECQLSAYLVPGPILGNRDIAIENERKKKVFLYRGYVLEVQNRKTDKKQIIKLSL